MQCTLIYPIDFYELDEKSSYWSECGHHCLIQLRVPLAPPLSNIQENSKIAIVDILALVYICTSE